MGPQPTVRPARPDDAAAVCRLIAAIGREEGEAHSPFAADHYMREGFGPGAALHFLVAEAGGAAVGYAASCRTYDIATATRGLHLVDLYVVPGWRGRGVGRKLMDAVAARCLDLGGSWLNWSVRPDNDAAFAFYERLGAERDAGVPLYLWLDGDGDERP